MSNLRATSSPKQNRNQLTLCDISSTNKFNLTNDCLFALNSGINLETDSIFVILFGAIVLLGPRFILGGLNNYILVSKNKYNILLCSYSFHIVLQNTCADVEVGRG